MAHPLTRAALAIVALAVAAVFAFGYRSADLQEQGEEVLRRAQAGEVSFEEQRRAQDLLRRADRYNPDLAPLLAEGFLLQASGRLEEAYAIGLRSVAKEPENVQAWTLLALTARGRGDPRTPRRRVRELNPLLAEVLFDSGR